MNRLLTMKHFIFINFLNNKHLYNIVNNFTKDNIKVCKILKIKLNEHNKYNDKLINFLKSDDFDFIKYLSENNIKFIRCHDYKKFFVLFIDNNDNIDNILDIVKSYGLNLFISKNDEEYSFLINNITNLDFECSFHELLHKDSNLFTLTKINIDKIVTSFTGSKSRVKIEETPHYKYLVGNKDIYINYSINNLGGVLTDNHTPEHFNKLLNNFCYGKKVNNVKSYLSIDKNNKLLDGNHRCSILKHKINNNIIKDKEIFVYRFNDNWGKIFKK